MSMIDMIGRAPTTINSCKNYDEGHPMCEEQACGKCLSFDPDINFLALLETLRKRIDKNTAALEDLINHVFESRELKREYDTWKSQHDYSRIIKKLEGEPLGYHRGTKDLSILDLKKELDMKQKVDIIDDFMSKPKEEQEAIRNEDLCHKCNLKFSLHSRDFSGILICPKEEKKIKTNGCKGCNYDDLGWSRDHSPCYGCYYNNTHHRFERKEAEPIEMEPELLKRIMNMKLEPMKTIGWYKRRHSEMIVEFIEDLKEQRIYDDVLIAKWRARKDGN